jgi:hypothetical protein
LGLIILMRIAEVRHDTRSRSAPEALVSCAAPPGPYWNFAWKATPMVSGLSV